MGRGEGGGGRGEVGVWVVGVGDDAMRWQDQGFS